MKLEKLAPLAEIISSVAILITLVYLAIQTQQTNEALLANSREVIMMADLSLITTVIEHPEVNARAQMPMSGLTFEEREQVGNAIAGMVRNREFAWFQYQNGIMDRQAMESYMGTLVRWINYGEVPRYYWDLFAKEIDPEFVSYVEARLEQAP